MLWRGKTSCRILLNDHFIIIWMWKSNGCDHCNNWKNKTKKHNTSLWYRVAMCWCQLLLDVPIANMMPRQNLLIQARHQSGWHQLWMNFNKKRYFLWAIYLLTKIVIAPWTLSVNGFSWLTVCWQVLFHPLVYVMYFNCTMEDMALKYHSVLNLDLWYLKFQSLK